MGLEAALDLEKNNRQLLETRILEFYQKLYDRGYKLDGHALIYLKVAKQFKEHFNITTNRYGEIREVDL